MRSLLHFFASLRLTVWLLLASLVLVFFGTLDQVDLGVRGAQMKYFENVLTTWGYPSTWILGKYLHVVHLPIPGGYLIGPLMVLNLLCAHFSHFKARWAFGGIVLIHFGVFLLILSQLATQLLQEEYYIWFDEGETVRHLTSFEGDELAIIDQTEADADTVIAIPAERLLVGEMVSDAALPFRIETLHFFRNAAILENHSGGLGGITADQGLAISHGLSAQPVAPTFKSNERNGTSAYIRLHAGERVLGTWLVSNLFESTMPPQSFVYEGRSYRIALRFARKPLASSLTLLDFAHDRYPGTNIPHNFSSQLKLEDGQTGESREVLIRMNHPLRYAGYTFYQSGFGLDAMGREDGASHLQVVRNPGWLGPYVACTLISLGLIWQFSWGLLKFSSRRKARASQAAANHQPERRSLSKRILGWVLAGVLALSAFSILAKPLREQSGGAAGLEEMDLSSFGRLPLLDGGRLKPLDTLARNTLLLTRAKQTALDGEGHRVRAIEFLAQLLFDPEAAANYQIFRLDNPDVLDLVGQPNTETTHLSYAELQTHLRQIDEQARLVPEEAPERSPYHTALLKLYRSILRYQSLENAILPQLGRGQNHLEALSRLLEPETAASGGGAPHPQVMANFLRQQINSPGLLLIPTTGDVEAGGEAVEWISPGAALLGATITGSADPMLRAYLELSDAWRGADADGFSGALDRLRATLGERMEGGAKRTGLEFLFNRVQPFYLSLQLYILAFLGAALFWLIGSPLLNRTGVALAAVALVIHTLGLASRVYLSGYAPVTNLYSSSVFVGWAAVLFALPFERLFRNGLATAAASLTGFTTLIIAHNIAVAGGADTMEMMRAVLDSNFWLSTHVTTITIGYSTTFLAGALGILYVLLQLAPRGPDAEAVASLKRMVYGLICFALLFSFVGTILGGIWADQSWGRFWGWDPKENGALMIVLWNALILHGLRTTMIGTRGLMLLAIFGNVITSWSWFGTNMLGVGLHSYGFMDKAFLWLVTFWGSQLFFIAFGWALSKRTYSRSAS